MPDRRLAAVLAADIVGYSALMAEDEVGTLKALRRLRRELFHPAVAGHRGKVVKAMGDGWLVEFASAVDAVNCAVIVQNGLIDDPTIRVRIGVHIGDITHEEEDIFGDGVNVAARLEAQAEPGAVAISDAVYGALDGTLRPSFEDAGERRLKNIPRPVRVWMRSAAPEASAPAHGAAPNPQRAGFPVVVAIQPVSTTDPRPELRELAAALTSDLFTYLDNGRWLSAKVAERPPEAAYVLSENLRARGDRLRLETDVTAPDGGLLWSKRADGLLQDSFDWQDQTGADIAAGATAAIQDAERSRIKELPDPDRTAADWLQLELMRLAGKREAIETKIVHLEKAIALEPDWGLLHAVYAEVLERALAADPRHSDERQKVLDAAIGKAREHADGDVVTELMAAYAEHRLRPALGRLMVKIEAVLRRFPYHEQALITGGTVAVYAGEAEMALDCGRKLLVSSGATPRAGIAYILIGGSLIQLGRDDEAYEAMQRALEISPDSVLHLRTFVSAAALAGYLDEAKAALTRLEEVSPGVTIASVRRMTQYADTPGTRHYFDGLRMAGMPEGDE